MPTLKDVFDSPHSTHAEFTWTHRWLRFGAGNSQLKSTFDDVPLSMWDWIGEELFDIEYVPHENKYLILKATSAQYPQVCVNDQVLPFNDIQTLNDDDKIKINVLVNSKLEPWGHFVFKIPQDQTQNPSVEYNSDSDSEFNPKSSIQNRYKVKI